MGAAVGEKFARAAELALQKKLPLVAFTVSGGARMQEGLVSLMQMSKTAAMIGRLDQEGLPYIVVLKMCIRDSFPSTAECICNQKSGKGFAGVARMSAAGGF